MVRMQYYILQEGSIAYGQLKTLHLKSMYSENCIALIEDIKYLQFFALGLFFFTKLQDFIFANVYRVRFRLCEI